MSLADEALRCPCADAKMELVKVRRIAPFFGESLNHPGLIRTYRCPNCGAVIVKTVAPERDGTLPDAPRLSLN